MEDLCDLFTQTDNITIFNTPTAALGTVLAVSEELANERLFNKSLEASFLEDNSPDFLKEQENKQEYISLKTKFKTNIPTFEQQVYKDLGRD